MRLPWFKYYPGDWRAEARLRVCSLAARGLWIELLGLMHEGDPRGYLTIGKRRLTEMDVKLIATQIASEPRSIARCLEELSSNGVFSTDDDGCIYSRRMVRDEELKRRDQENGKLGGNPNLKPRHIPRVNPGDKAQN